MGQDKGSLIFKNQPMILHTLNTLKENVDEIIIVLNDSNRIAKYKEFIKDDNIIFKEDLIKNKGPLQGILTGLYEIQSSHTLVLPCDTPFISKHYINKIFNEYNDNYDAIVPFSDEENLTNSIEPLHGIYKKSNIKIIEKLIDEDKLKIKDFIDKINCKFIKIENKKEFENLNYPKDLNKFY